MKKFFVTHSKNFNYQKELYDTIKTSKINREFEILYTTQFEDFQTIKDELRKVDCLICEVTYPTIEIGIEMEWARSVEIPIISIAYKGTGVSKGVRLISHKVIEYTSSEDLIINLEECVEELGMRENKMNIFNF